MAKKNFETMEALLQGLDKYVDVSHGSPLETEDAKRNSFSYSEYKYYDRPKIVEKKFAKNSYNGPSVLDFIQRLNMMHEVAIYRLDKELKVKRISPAEYGKKVQKLQIALEDCRKALEADCEIPPVSLDELKSREKSLDPIVNKAMGYIRKYIYQGLAMTDPNAFESEKSLTDALSRYALDESRLTAERGRPNFVNHYPNPLDEEGTFTSIQRGVGHVIPSTERDDKQEGKIPNFVQCGLYFTNGDGNRELEFKGYRHSSYPPIRIKDDLDRQKRAAEIAKSMLVELAKQKMLAAAGARVIQPIQLSLSSVTLLTPYHRTDAIVPAGEEEHRQLLESYNAMMLYNNRQIELDIDGQKVKVKLDLTMFNAPGNPAGVSASKKGNIAKWAVQSELERNINAQGMTAFADRVCDYLSEGTVIVGQCIINIQDALDFNKNELTRLKFHLAQKNKYLESVMKFPSLYPDAKREVDKLNKEIFKLERQRMDALQKYAKEHRQEISLFLSDQKSKDPRDQKSQVAELFLETLLMYTDGKVEPIQYGARMLLANQKMGREVDFYCKSGEDRTGRMQNMVEELCIFYRHNGRYPSYDLHGKCINKVHQLQQDEAALMVNEFSVSRDITGANSVGARGLQITDKLLIFRAKANEMLPARSGDKIGKTAKGVYSLADSAVSGKIFGVEGSRKGLLKETIESNRGNALLETKSRLDFSSRVVRAENRAVYEQNKGNPLPPRANITTPTYVAHRLQENDLIVSERRYNNTIARIEKDIHSVKDVTKVPDGGLDSTTDEEIAIEQAFSMVNPPFDAKSSMLILSGSDDSQVARIHAVLLVLQSKVPSLKGLEVEVEGDSPQPQEASKPSLQKKYNQAFIEEHLSTDAIEKINQKRSELKELIAKQKSMKSVIKADRPKEGELNMIEGASIEISRK